MLGTRDSYTVEKLEMFGFRMLVEGAARTKRMVMPQKRKVIPIPTKEKNGLIERAGS